MHDTTQADTPRTGRFFPIARLGLLAVALGLGLAACRGLFLGQSILYQGRRCLRRFLQYLCELRRAVAVGID